MLLRPDAQFLDKAVNRYERIFPRGTDWLNFRSQLPGQEVFANSVLDPAIGIAGELGLRAFATVDDPITINQRAERSCSEGVSCCAKCQFLAGLRAHSERCVTGSD